LEFKSQLLTNPPWRWGKIEKMKALDQIKKMVVDLPKEKKHAYGFYTVDVSENCVHFQANPAINWWANTVLPIVEKARELGLETTKVYGDLWIQ
jgi:hypothetical protein